MARRRMIDPEFWFDPEIGSLDSDSQLTYIGSWNFADDYGVIEYNPLLIKAKIFPYKDVRVEECIQKLVKLGKYVIFEANGKKWIHIKNFLEYQKVDRPSKNRNPSPPTRSTLASPRDEVKLNEVKRSETKLSEGKGSGEGKPIYPSPNGSGSRAKAEFQEKLQHIQALSKTVPILIVSWLLFSVPLRVQASTLTVRYQLTTGGGYHLQPHVAPKVQSKASLPIQKREASNIKVAATMFDEPVLSTLPKDRAIYRMVQRFGKDHIASFEALVNSESHFRPDAVNPSSGACGIFQAYPCEKMGCSLTDVDCQVQWGLDYISRRYGNPTEAWLFKKSHNWY